MKIHNFEWFTLMAICIFCLLCFISQAQQYSKSAPVTPQSKVKNVRLQDIQRRDSLSSDSTDDSIQEMLNLEIIRKQIEEKLKQPRLKRYEKIEEKK